MALLRIKRLRRAIDAGREYVVVVDGSDADAVANGQTVTVPVVPGNHTVMVRKHRRQSDELVVAVPADAGDVEVTCGPRASGLAAFLIPIFELRKEWAFHIDAGAAEVNRRAGPSGFDFGPWLPSRRSLAINLLLVAAAVAYMAVRLGR